MCSNMPQRMRNLKKEKHNEKLIFILIAILILAFILNIYLFISLSRIIEISELDASIIVSDKIGFDLNSTALTFGGVMQEGSSVREISIENNFGFPIEVYVYGDNGMENFIIPIKERIEKNEKKSIKITAFVPEDAVFGKYEGSIKVALRRH